MTEPMIPLSVIDALIEKYRNEYDGSLLMEKLEEIKKEATFVQSPIEQKIKARLEELFNNEWDGVIDYTIFATSNQARIDELRKLLE